MLSGYLDYLSKLKIVLASDANGRKKLLTDAGLQFKVMPSGFVEEMDIFGLVNPVEYVKELCHGKFNSVCNSFNDYDILILADTVCVVDKKIIEKPVTKEDHIRMIKELRDAGEHEVVSWVMISFRKNNTQITEEFESRSVVELAYIPDKSIDKYLDNYPLCLNASGGYVMDPSASTIIKHVNGSMTNLMGLPLSEVCVAIIEAIERGCI